MGAPGCPSPVPPGVETPYFQGGPNHEPARELVERVAHELGLEPAIELIEVPDTEAATQLRFLGSPTVRVDGRDVERGAEMRTDFALPARTSLALPTARDPCANPVLVGAISRRM